MFHTLKKRLGSLLLAAAMILPASAGAWAMEPQAKIGNTTYNTLWEAMEDVQNGQTIEVLRNISNEELVLICPSDEAFNITIDLNGYTISENTGDTPAFTYLSGGGNVAPKVTLKDGSINCTSKAPHGSPYASGIWMESTDKKCRPVMILEHMVISSETDAGVNCIDGQLQVLSARVNGYEDAIYAQDSTVYIQAGSFYTGTDNNKDGALASVDSKIEMTAKEGIVEPKNWKQLNSTLVRVTWFEDVPSYMWYYEPIYDMAKRGLVSGTSVWSFEPDSNINRASVVTMLAKASGEDISGYAGSTSYADVQKGSWYDCAVGWAHAKGIASGYNNDTFGPLDPVTRQQLAVMLLSYQKKIMKEPVVETTEVPAFTDMDKIAPWAKDAVMQIVREGIMSGSKQDDGTVQLQPENNTTRAQACVMLRKLLTIG